MKNPPIEILATGANGEVGRQLSKLCKKNEIDFHSCTDSSLMLTHPNAYLIHLAAKHPSATISQLIESNLVFLSRILSKRVDSQTPFIFISSTSVYGKNFQGCAAEDSCHNGLDYYGMTKLQGEALVQERMESSVSVRCPAILEHNSSRNFMSYLFDELYKGNAVKLRNSNKLFNTFVSVEQLLDLILRISTSNSGHNTINLAVKQELTLSDVVDIIKSEINSKSTIVHCKDEFPHYRVSVQKVLNEYDCKFESTETYLRRWCKERLLARENPH
ncbi:MAG: NAD-dependent epimerase/dehydratase family protein [Aestuariibacter sp.]